MAKSVSLNSLTSNPIEQAFTGSFCKPDINATTALESTPPDKKEPNGTSATIRISTASVKRSANWSLTSSFVRVRSKSVGISQYSSDSGIVLMPLFNVILCPGDNLNAF